MDLWEKCVDFHGHTCGGVSLGFVLANFALDKLNAKRGDDLYARMECHNCLVDAVQCVTGCTLGKRNLEIVPGGNAALTLKGCNNHYISDFGYIGKSLREEGRCDIINTPS